MVFIIIIADMKSIFYDDDGDVIIDTDDDSFQKRQDHKRRRLNEPSSLRLDRLFFESEAEPMEFFDAHHHQNRVKQDALPAQSHLNALFNVQNVSSEWMEKNEPGLIPDNVYCGRLPLIFKDAKGTFIFFR